MQIHGRLCHLTPASLLAGRITNSRAPLLRGRYPASSLLRTHPPPSRLRPTSRVTGYTTDLSPPISRWGEDGFSSCSARPCHRAAASTPPERPVATASVRRNVLPSTSTYGLGLRSYCFSRLLMRSHSLRPGDSLTTPRMALSVGFRPSVSLRSATQATGLLTFALAGLTPAEHARLSWTHYGQNTRPPFVARLTDADRRRK